MKNFVRILGGLCLMFWSFGVGATIYYVNDNSLTGDVFGMAVGKDGNSGTSASSPFRTLKKALTLAVAGDIIYIDKGDYSGKVNYSSYSDANGGGEFGLSITVDNLTIIGAGMNKTVFTSNNNKGTFLTVLANNFQISNLTITSYGYGTGGGSVGQAVTIGNATTTYNGIVFTDVQLDRNGGSTGESAVYIKAKTSSIFTGGGASCNTDTKNYSGAFTVDGKNINLQILNYIMAYNAGDCFGGTAGGAMRIKNGDATQIVTLRNTLFSKNQACADFHAMDMYITTGNINVYDCIFENSSSRLLSSGTFVGGSVSIIGSPVVKFSRSIFRNHTSSGNMQGCAIGNNGGTVTIDSCSFTGNSASSANDVHNTSGTINASYCTWSEIGQSGGTFTIVNSGNPTVFEGSVTKTNTTTSIYTPNPFVSVYSGTCGSVIICTSPTASAGSAVSAICQSGTSTAMGGSIGGSATSGTWSGGAGTWTNATNPFTATYTASSSESGSITLTLTATSASCGTTSVSKTITVNPSATSNAGSAATICSGSSYTLAGSSVGGSANTGAWSITSVTGTMTNASAQLSSTAQTATPSTITFTPIAGNTGTVTLTLTTDDPAGTCTSASSTVVLTVVSPATSNAGSAATICSGSSYTLAGSSVGGSANTGAWSINSVTGTMTNASAQLSSTAQTATPSTITFTPIAGNTGTVTLILTTDDPAGTCIAATSTVVLTIVSAISLTATPTQIVCNGGKGSVILSSSGATPLTYGGDATTNLSEGSYNYTVTDANGCTATASATISAEPAAITLTATPTQIVCNGGKGSVILSSSGATPVVYGGDATTNLSEGNYNYTVTDANGCTATASATINTEPAAITFTATPTQIVCNGGKGSVTLSSSGATPLTYGGDATTNLTAGTYNYTVTDANGCTATASATINTEPAAITLTATPTQIVCNGGKGSVILSSSGATPLTYGGDATTNLSAGNYNYTVTDANGCTATGSATINAAPSAIILDTNITNIKCWEDADGSIEAIVSNGKAPYEYYWSVNPNVPQIITNDKTKSKQQNLDEIKGVSVYVKDANGCVSNQINNIEVKQPDPLVMNPSVDASVKMNCFGVKDGAITISPKGGVLPYSYSWTGNGVSIGSKDQTGLASGDYFVSIKDANNCSKSGVKITIGTHPQITFEVDTIQPSCYDDLGKINVKNVIPSDAYRYKIDQENYKDSTIFRNLLADNLYTISVKNTSNGCESSKKIPIGSVKERVILSGNSSDFSFTDMTCSNKTSSINYLNPKLGYTYSIDYFTTFNTTGKFENLAPGNYKVVVRSKDNCKDTSEIFVVKDVLYSSKPNATQVKKQYCDGDKASSLVPTLNSSYVWYDQQGILLNTNDKLYDGLYYVGNIEPGKCESDRVEIDVDLSRMSLNLISKKAATCNKQDGEIIIQAVNGIGQIKYTWSNTDGQILGNNAKLVGVSDGTYIVEAEDAIGCKVISTPPISMTCTTPEIPQIVTPDNDGNNDTWKINYKSSYPRVKVQIYNRWGNLVYESQPYEDNWDGKPSVSQALGKNELPTGTYYYVIDKQGDGTELESGFVELIK